eukprot:2205087-Amphidinium_carterae.2
MGCMNMRKYSWKVLPSKQGMDTGVEDSHAEAMSNRLFGSSSNEESAKVEIGTAPTSGQGW